MVGRSLELYRCAPHSRHTCGQSRRRGLISSYGERRSKHAFGRVVVTHVQGSPKGGDALGSPGEINTRLRSVPLRLGVLMPSDQTIHQITSCASQSLTPALAWEA